MDLKNYLENLKTDRDWEYIIIHHSLSADGKVNDWEMIRDYHMGLIGSIDNPYRLNPMRDIGYHFGLEFDNNNLVYRIGRSLDIEGGHTLGRNFDSIGICLVGNYDFSEPSHQQYLMIGQLCKLLMNKFSITIQKVLPHWAFSQKTCPGRKFDILKLRVEYIGKIV